MNKCSYIYLISYTVLILLFTCCNNTYNLSLLSRFHVASCVCIELKLCAFVSESLRGARVLVTGASTGIGEQMAYHYARFGAQIVITARREKVLQQVSELAENGIKKKKKHISLTSVSIMSMRENDIGLHYSNKDVFFFFFLSYAYKVKCVFFTLFCSSCTGKLTHSFWSMLKGGRKVLGSGSPESSLYSSRHGQWLRPWESGRFCSGETWMVGLPGSQPHWSEPLQHVEGRCWTCQVADEGNAAFRCSVSI